MASLPTPGASLDTFGDELNAYLLELQTGVSLLRSRGRWRGTPNLASLLAPNAPLGRKVMAALPAVVMAGTNPGVFQTADLTNTTPVGHKRLTVCAGADWKQNGAGQGWCANQNSVDLASGTKSPGSVLMGTDTTKLTLGFRSWPGHVYRISVDYLDGSGRQYATDVNGSLGARNGSDQYVSIPFPDNKPKRVKADWDAGDLFGVWVDSAIDTTWAVKPRGPRMVIIGDSYLGGSGEAPTGYGSLGSYGWTVADELGWEDVIMAGIGGTGWVAGSQNFQNRAVRVAGWGVDGAVLAGGRNDQGVATAAQITAAVTATLNIIRTGSPEALLMLTGPFSTGDPVDGSVNTTWKPVQDAIFAGALPEHRALTTDTVASGIFTGTARVGVGGTGNGARYVQAVDGVHPSQAGADYLGRRLAPKFIEMLLAA